MRQGRGSDADTAGSASRDGWRLLLGQMRAQWVGLTAGVAVGLFWTIGRVSIPSLVQRAIDQGMEENDDAVVVHYAIVIALVALVTASCTGLRRYMAFREARRA